VILQLKEIAPRNRAFLEKTVAAQLARKLSVFYYGTQHFVIEFTTAASI
jgi:hypothetical protein